MTIITPLCLFGQDKNQPSAAEEAVKASLTDQEWALVDKEGNPVKRVRKLLDIAAYRLGQAQMFTAREQYSEASSLLESYTTIISYTMDLIDRLPENERKRQRSAYKEFDVQVRKQLQTLQELKRNLPVDNQAIENALFTAQRLRIIALNRFSGAEIIKVPEEKP
ncbi:MAG: hypothetical protein HY314_06170 [Acidobacteria bacterium]|nr:hypothetical protein [Acidobacteriota bacterium]